jgi:DNA-binding transcriptional ArsR family regulator
MSKLPPLFAALSDPTRFAIVEKLLAEGECTAGDLAGVAEISAPAISRHLKTLREARMIRQRVAGTHRYYSVEPCAIHEIATWSMDHKTFWEGSLDRLARAFSGAGQED